MFSGRANACKFLLKNGADIHAPGPSGSMGAIRLCEHKFDLFNIELRRGKMRGINNPYEACLEVLEEHAEELEISNEKL